MGWILEGQKKGVEGEPARARTSLKPAALSLGPPHIAAYRFIIFLSLTALLAGCTTVLKVANLAFEFCPDTAETTHQYFGSPDTDDLIIFIHGLCGDAKTTWTNPATHFVFPETLARDFAKENKPVYVVSFSYVSRLHDAPSILSIADHLEFEISELLKTHPYRTLRIVGHSMGGLVAREYILRRQPRFQPELKVTNLVLLATPSNGSELAAMRRLIPEHRQIDELRHIDKGNTYLQSLNHDWNVEFKGEGHPRHLLLYAGYEEQGMPALGEIVKLSSAIVYADRSMGFQENHVSIAKPKERNELYDWVNAKLRISLKETTLQLLDGMIKQGLLTKVDALNRFPHSVALLEDIQTELAGTELERALAHVKEGQFQNALALLGEDEQKQTSLDANTAKIRFVRGQIYELQFQNAKAASNYSEAVRLNPANALYRQRYGLFLVFRGEARRAVLQFHEALRLSRSSGNLHLEVATLNGLGVAYSSLGKYTMAMESHDQAHAISVKTANLQGEVESLGELGNSHFALSQYTKAIGFYERTLVIYRKIGDVRGEGHSLGNLGSVYYRLEQYARSKEFHEQALAIHRKVGDVMNEGIVLGNLGLVYDAIKQYPKAIEFHTQALEIHRKIGNSMKEGLALGNLGIVYAALRQYPEARKFQKQALELSQKISDPQGEGNALQGLGSIYASQGQQVEAIEYYEQALVIHRKIGDVRSEGEDMGSLGSAYAALGRYPEALKFLSASEIIFERNLGIRFPWKALFEQIKNDLR